MAKILYAGELGDDLGHLQRFLTLAPQLAARGHEVVFAARDLSRCETLPGMQAFMALQAPVWLPHVNGLPEPQVCHADVLLRNGYRDENELLGLIKGWRSLFDMIEPQLLIADNAPSALLAARGLGLPRISYGDGFFSPPYSTPLPNLRPWLKLPPRHIEDSESAVLRIVNRVLAALGTQPLAALADLFTADDYCLLLPEELMCCEVRVPAHCLGPVLNVNGGVTPEWPGRAGKKIFIYTRLDNPHSKQLFMHLLDSTFNVLAYVPGLSEQQCREMQAPNIHFSARPVAMRYVTRHAKAIVCHADTGTLLHGLFAGLPVLLLPSSLAQELTARNVARLGMGISVDPDAGTPDYNALIRELVKNPRYARCVQRFARKYAVNNAEQVMATVVRRCEDLMNAAALPV